MQLQQLLAEYLAELARQLSFVSAFLGGFAATFLGTLLFAPAESRAARWAIALTALSSSTFIVAVLWTTMLTVGLDPHAPGGAVSARGTQARVISVLAVMVGIYALLASIGLSGWLRSRRLGWITSTIATVAALLATWAIAS